MTPRQSGIATRPRRHAQWACSTPGGVLLVLCLLALGTSSCGGKYKVPILPLTFNPAMTQMPEPMPPPEVAATLPEATSVALVIPPPRPRRPAVRSNGAAVAAEAEPEVDPASKPAPPRIVLRLSPAQESDYRQRTNQAIAVAEKNLHSVSSNMLSADQRDLVEKIRGFLSQAREAVRSGDWVRAQNVAQKAQVLSEELIGLK